MEEKKKIDTKSIVGRFAYSNRRFGGLRNSSKGGKTKSKETSAEKIAETDSATPRAEDLTPPSKSMVSDCQQSINCFRFAVSADPLCGFVS